MPTVKKTIKIKSSTHAKLCLLGRKGESFDTLILRLATEYIKKKEKEC